MEDERYPAANSQFSILNSQLNKMPFRRLLPILVFALLGYGVFFLLFPRVDPAARWGVAIDRKAAVVRAREAASRFGQDVEGWRAMVTARYNRSLEYYIFSHDDTGAGSLAARLLTPVSISVKFID